MEVKLTIRAVECWPKGLSKERASIYPDLLAQACAKEGGSGALAPDWAAAAKVWIVPKSQLLRGVVRK